jgi:hypothetical protein
MEANALVKWGRGHGSYVKKNNKLLTGKLVWENGNRRDYQI